MVSQLTFGNHNRVLILVDSSGEVVVIYLNILKINSNIINGRGRIYIVKQLVKLTGRLGWEVGEGSGLGLVMIFGMLRVRGVRLLGMKCFVRGGFVGCLMLSFGSLRERGEGGGEGMEEIT